MAKVKFYDAVKSGSVIELIALKKGQDDDTIVCLTQALVNGNLVFSCEMTLMVMNE